MNTKSHLEPLESRIAPATIFVVDGNEHLLRFESATPGTIDADLVIDGIGTGEVIRGMDSRPATGEIYLLTIDTMDAGRIYTINPVTAVATPVSSTPFSTTVSANSSYGFDFNPVSDHLRIVNIKNQSFRVNPDTGALLGQDNNVDDPVTVADHITSVAYDRNFSGATATTLYGIDFSLDTLVRIGGVDGNPSPNLGLVTTVGSLGASFGITTGFDIANDGIAYFAAKNNNIAKFSTVNLATGGATVVGEIGGNPTGVVALTVYQPVAKIGPTGKTATYYDVDGDVVTVSVNKGKLATADFRLISAGGFGRGQLVELDLTDDAAGLEGANLTITAKKAPALGDGRADVGTIKTDYDLANVTVKGDIGKLIAGDLNSATTAIKKLTAGSIGMNAHATVLDGDYFSMIKGGLGSMNLSGDLSTLINVSGPLGSAKIGGDLRGVFGVQGEAGTILVGGSVDGRDGAGYLDVTKIKSIKVAGSIIGGSQRQTGYIFAGNIGSITIGESLIGGLGASTGAIRSQGMIGTVKIGGDLVGGRGVHANLNGGVFRVSGGIVADELGTVSIGGSVMSAEVTSSFSGLIASASKIGSIAVKGGLFGNADTQVHIVAGGLGGSLPTGVTTDLAIGKLTVGGRVQYANVVAGFTADTSTSGMDDAYYGLATANADASIGSVAVGRDWVASNLVAGAQNAAWVMSAKFGDSNDSLQSGGNSSVIAKIANVLIKGRVFGTAATDDHYGFVSEQIMKISIAGSKLPLTAAKDPSLLLAPLTNDVRIHEV